jgi:hypothetical protein
MLSSPRGFMSGTLRGTTVLAVSHPPSRPPCHPSFHLPSHRSRGFRGGGEATGSFASPLSRSSGSVDKDSFFRDKTPGCDCGFVPNTMSPPRGVSVLASGIITMNRMHLLGHFGRLASNEAIVHLSGRRRQRMVSSWRRATDEWVHTLDHSDL